MTTIAVTGATGRLGRLVVAALLDRGIPARSIIAAVRSPEKAADFGAQGVQVRHADYSKPDALAPALAGADRVLLISGTPGDRVNEARQRHRRRQARDVALIAYTGILNADSTTMLLAADHQATEQLIKDSGLPYAFLRNGWSRSADLRWGGARRPPNGDARIVDTYQRSAMLKQQSHST